MSSVLVADRGRASACPDVEKEGGGLPSAALSLIKYGAMDIPSSVRRTTSEVISRAKHVKIEFDAVAKLVDGVKIERSHWMSEAPVQFDDLYLEAHLRLLFTFNAVSFSYWGDPKWSVSYRGKMYDGTWAMLIALRKAIDLDADAFKPEWLASVERGRFAELLQGSSLIPLFEERFKILRDLGSVMLEMRVRTFGELIEEADYDAVSLLQNIVARFASFEDSATFFGHRVDFYKRAQLLVADLHFALRNRGGRGLRGWKRLTACADYKLPQVLRHFGIISYSPSLANLIDRQKEILPGSEEEVEIRAATVQAVEIICDTLREEKVDIAPMELNDSLWLAGQYKSSGMKPYHRVRSVAY